MGDIADWEIDNMLGLNGPDHVNIPVGKKSIKPHLCVRYTVNGRDEYVRDENGEIMKFKRCRYARLHFKKHFPEHRNRYDILRCC